MTSVFLNMTSFQRAFRRLASKAKSMSPTHKKNDVGTIPLNDRIGAKHAMMESGSKATE